MRHLTNSLGQQGGAVLIIGLIMLLLLTIIGLASIRGSGLQEQMAGNLRDKNLAFQAAEASLRAGEEIINGVSLPDFTGAEVGYYPDLNKVTLTAPKPTLRPVSWTDTNWTAWSVQLPNNTLSELYEQPRYVIERLVVSAASSTQGGCVDFECKAKTPDPIYYRITSRAKGGTLDAEVILQSTFADKN